MLVKHKRKLLGVNLHALASYDLHRLSRERFCIDKRRERVELLHVLDLAKFQHQHCSYLIRSVQKSREEFRPRTLLCIPRGRTVHDQFCRVILFKKADACQAYGPCNACVSACWQKFKYEGNFEISLGSRLMFCGNCESREYLSGCVAKLYLYIFFPSCFRICKAHDGFEQ